MSTCSVKLLQPACVLLRQSKRMPAEVMTLNQCCDNNADFFRSKPATTKDVASIQIPGNINRVNNMVKLGIGSLPF